MAVIIDGKKIAEKVIDNIKKEVDLLERKPKLAVILVGNNPASEIYVRNKQKMALKLGFDSVVLTLPADISEENLLEQIYILNEDVNINAILVQLPLPAHLNKQRILEAIEPLKDVDGFTTHNFGRLSLGYFPCVVPCTPKGIVRLLDEYDISLEGKKVLVIGRSNIVGKPISLLMQNRNATVTMAHSKTKNLEELILSNDIIISAVGITNIVNQVSKGAVVIDVGINRTENGLKGDVNFELVSENASYITPVPGGVGPMTIAMLMENTLELFKIQEKLLF
ncbi:MAG: bifunctional 5,10-methylene-tetrahydrofolate dehydrogenase/5,10-methylene-tetrahydrofolate cyclohydrolase [Cyanobacteria bacterium SIG29]|nr:bifunctional 5,10-methylene-tetrahydrofolate dehydrogenase/5,10-methylene-tetrahydrofolate cyclohydrolase [Cyanobacteria bacterium SIG29]